MPGKRSLEWSRLDNAAKIFPSTSSKTDTNVFRFYCELKSPIDSAVLQNAVNTAIKDFPNFLCVMKKGAFWYYLEQCDIEPVVIEESKTICSPIYEDKKKLLLEISYYKNRINLEIYHALSDGTGAMQLLKTIVYHYIKILHKAEFGDDLPLLDNDASFAQKSSDSFRKYYQKIKNTPKTKSSKSYKLKMKKRDADHLQVIEGIASVKNVLEVAHKYNTTLTIYLTAVYMDAIHKEMSLQNERRPVVLNIPVNLRKIFPSETTKNFFGMIGVEYNYSKKTGDFADMIATIDRSFKEELQKDRLSARMNKLSALEHNPFIRIAPLPLKNIALRWGRRIADSKVTAVISNVGKVDMPQEMASYIDMFGVLASTLRLQLCISSFGDRLQMGFTSSFVSTDIQKNFFRMLTENGIDVEIRSNDFDISAGEMKKDASMS
ncbi:MAG: hypothetical protein A2Y17_10555 [Clostridiales bacterium GWF2_38_85]|nr:MAG: hypothetical protein A2Y17_10555 [Clostridiales bacterium GWF2_38_85]HBL84610.1 hypothetical protein [Clostridiales bacterium]